MEIITIIQAKGEPLQIARDLQMIVQMLRVMTDEELKESKILDFNTVTAHIEPRKQGGNFFE